MEPHAVEPIFDSAPAEPLELVGWKRRVQRNVGEQHQRAVQLRGWRVKLNRRRVPSTPGEDVYAKERFLIGALERVASAGGSDAKPRCIASRALRRQ